MNRTIATTPTYELRRWSNGQTVCYQYHLLNDPRIALAEVWIESVFGGSFRVQATWPSNSEVGQAEALSMAAILIDTARLMTEANAEGMPLIERISAEDLAFHRAAHAKAQEQRA
jgi:hypothetical protein